MRKLLLIIGGIVLAWNLLTLVRTWQAKRAMVRLQPKPTLPPRPPVPPQPTAPTLPVRAPVTSASTG